jgi:hypothetical protein
MANTTNLNLVKPAGTDKALVSVLNSNSDKIDAWAGTTNQALSTLDAKTKSKTKYINDTSKTGFAHIQDDFANIGDREIQFYSIRPSDNNLVGYMVRFNQGYGDGILMDIVTLKSYRISNINGTWSMNELALKSDLDEMPRLKIFGQLTIKGGDFQKQLSNYIKNNIYVYGNPIFVVGWYSGSPTNLPSTIPESAGVFIAVLPAGLSSGIRVVELSTLQHGDITYAPD